MSTSDRVAPPGVTAAPAWGLPEALTALGLDALAVAWGPSWYLFGARPFFVVAVLAVLVRVRQVPAAQLGLAPASWRAEAGYALRLGAWCLGGALLVWGLLWVAVGAGGGRFEWPRDLADARWPTIRGYFVSAVLVAPLVEEPLYRALLYPPLRALCVRLARGPRAGRALALASGAAAFGALHLLYGVFWPHHLLAGLVFCWAFERRGALLAPILLHAGANLAVLAFNVWRLLDPARAEALLPGAR